MASTDNRLSSEWAQPGIATPSGAATASGAAVYRTPSDGNYGDAANVFGATNTPPNEDDIADKLLTNRVGVYENDVWWSQGGEIVKQNRTNSTWQVQASLSGLTSGESNHLGLWPWFSPTDNKRYLCTAHQIGAGPNWIASRHDPDKGTWQSGAIQSLASVSDALGSIHAIEQLGNELFFIGTSETEMYALNLQDMRFRSIPLPTSSRFPMSLAAYSGSMYLLYRETTTIKVGKVTAAIGSKLTLQHDGSDAVAVSSTSNRTSRCCLFADNAPMNLNFGSGFIAPSLYAFHHVDDASINGWNIFRLQEDGNGNLKQVQTINEVLPEDWAAGRGTAPSNGREDGVIKVLKDNPAYDALLPSPDRMFFRDDNAQFGNYAEYVFEPNLGSEWPKVTSFDQPPKVAIREDKIGGGVGYAPAGIGSPPEAALTEIFDIVYISGEVSDGDFRIHYRLHPSLRYHAGTQVVVRWYYDDDLHAPTRRCSLNDTSHGAIVGENIVGVPMLSGVDYYADWDFSSQNLNEFDRVNIAGIAFISGAYSA